VAHTPYYGNRKKDKRKKKKKEKNDLTTNLVEEALRLSLCKR
jgi:hypothetical protein